MNVSRFKISRRSDNSDVATGMNYGVLSSSSLSMSVCDLEMGITRIKGPQKTSASVFKGEHLNGARTSWPALIHQDMVDHKW